MMGDSSVTRVKTSKAARLDEEDEDELSDEPRALLTGSRGKTAAAALVLLLGVTAAVVFRKQPEEAPAPAPSNDPPLVLRESPPPVPPKPAPVSHLVGRIDPLGHASKSPTPASAGISPSHGANSEISDVASTSDRTAPPLLSSSYPGPAQHADTPPAVRPSAAPRLHRVRDGDTLSGLAKEYLGDGEMYMQIYDLNRGVLKEGPDLLPIGAQLKIPAADGLPPKADDTWQPHALVPIPEGALRREEEAREDSSAEPTRP